VSTPEAVNKEPSPEVDSAALERDLRRLAAASGRATRRMRVALGLDVGLKVMPVVLVVVVALLAVAKVRPSPLSDRALLAAGLLGCVLVLGLALRSAFRRLSPLAGAIALDRHHGLRGRVAGALSFAAVDEKARTAFMRLAIEDGAQHSKELEPRRAVPIPVPRELLLVTVLVFGVAGVALLEVPVVRHLPPPPAPKPLLMGADDLELFRDLGADLAKQSQNPEQQAAIGRYNRLVEDIAEHRVDRHEVFRRLAEIERDLAHGLEEQHEALDEGLEAVARELGRSELTRKASEAMSEKRLDDAEKALRELAERLKKNGPKPSAGELDRLRKALSRASEQSKERVQAIEARRRELQAERESLLKKKKEAGDAGAADTDKKLEENRRKLERLDRERSRAERSSGQMSELDKELAKAAEDLRKELGDAAKDLEQGAEKLNRMAREKLDDAQKRDLIRRLREMREVLRQEGQGGEGRKQRLERFTQRARGSKPGEGEEGGEPGKQQGKRGRPEIRLGRGQGEEIPGMESSSTKSGTEGGNDGKQGQGNEKGPGHGHGEGPDQGAASKIAGQTKDVSAAGIDTGEGAASAEVIYGASERGFTSKGYKDIFTDYETVSERVLEKDDIPSGYRFYVRRYFQLIRPRE